MVAHEKRNSAQLFCAVPTRNDLALSSLFFPAQPTQKLGYPDSRIFQKTARRWRNKIVNDMAVCVFGIPAAVSAATYRKAVDK